MKNNLFLSGLLILINDLFQNIVFFYYITFVFPFVYFYYYCQHIADEKINNYPKDSNFPSSEYLNVLHRTYRLSKMIDKTYYGEWCSSNLINMKIDLYILTTFIFLIVALFPVIVLLLIFLLFTSL